MLNTSRVDEVHSNHIKVNILNLVRTFARILSAFIHYFSSGMTATTTLGIVCSEPVAITISTAPSLDHLSVEVFFFYFSFLVRTLTAGKALCIMCKPRGSLVDYMSGRRSTQQSHQSQYFNSVYIIFV